jgi:hypothetical protein
LEGAVPTKNDAAAGTPFEVSMPITQPSSSDWVNALSGDASEFVVARFALAAPLAATERR